MPFVKTFVEVQVVDRSLKNLLPGISEAPHGTYVQLRHRLGVAEGSDEIPPGKALPFECNIDYMSGVSLSKVQFPLPFLSFHHVVFRAATLDKSSRRAPITQVLYASACCQ